MLRRTFLFGSVSAALRADTGRHEVHTSAIQSAALQPHSLVYLPPDHEAGVWPLLVFLHGGSGRGSDVNMVKRYGPPAVAERRGTFPFVVLSPQCPPGQTWTDADALMQLTDEVIVKYSLNPKHVYVTGMSMGGGGTWLLGARYPNRFGAILPMCGITYPAQWAPPLHKMPVWVFHGDRDKVIPIRRSIEMVKALKQVGNHARFTILKGKGHDITSLYYDDELYHWLLSKKIRHLS